MGQPQGGDGEARCCDDDGGSGGGARQRSTSRSSSRARASARLPAQMPTQRRPWGRRSRAVGRVGRDTTHNGVGSRNLANNKRCMSHGAYEPSVSCRKDEACIPIRPVSHACMHGCTTAHIDITEWTHLILSHSCCCFRCCCQGGSYPRRRRWGHQG